MPRIPEETMRRPLNLMLVKDTNVADLEKDGTAVPLPASGASLRWGAVR
ncbi:hypothetical protein [Nocardiopsis sp. L17-MgMaSL7]|nr:hypothetical protein [Nocardiopsis sp. L17-MgMaSL7]PWV48486.1 hypothetical protein BDW27_11038 [Nocardiopsis sp. L17-MgMaSL7]